MNWREEILSYRPQSPEEEADREQILSYVNQYGDFLLRRENLACHITASGFILSPQGDRVLMAHHNIYRVWAWTGGHADGETDLLGVALREAREETGAVHLRPLSERAASVEILPVWGHWKRGKYVPSHLHLNLSYLLTADPGDPLRPRPGENTQVAWLPTEGLLEKTNEWEMDPVYTKLLERGYKLLNRE